MQHPPREATSCRQAHVQCVACCLDPSTPRAQLVRFLSANTSAYRRRFGEPAVSRRASFLAHELERRHGADLLSALLLLVPPLAWVRAVYERRHIGCAWVGYLDRDRREVGCLLHPARNGGIDLRRVAPYISDPLRWCAPDFQCAASLKGHTAQADDWWAYSRAIRDFNRKRADPTPGPGVPSRPGFRIRRLSL